MFFCYLNMDNYFSNVNYLSIKSLPFIYSHFFDGIALLNALLSGKNIDFFFISPTTLFDAVL